MKYDLVGVDGNAFAIMGYVSKALKNEGLAYMVDEYRNQAMSGDYNHLLVISMDYVERANKKAEGTYDED